MPARQRPEPTLGQFDDIDADRLERNPRHRPGGAGGRVSARDDGRRGRAGAGPRQVRRPQRRFIATVAGIVLLLLAALAGWLNQDWLRQQVSGSHTASLVEAAVLAEQEGRWHGSADGDDALSLYRRILADDADNDPARLGLRRVAEQLLAEADQAIDRGEYEYADALIGELTDLGLPGSRIDELQSRLQPVEAGQVQAGALLAQARQALATGRIEGEDGALAIFRRMLATDPGNALARRGLDDALAARLDQARRDVTRGDLDQAQAGIDLVAAQSPQNAGLPAVRQALAQARQAQAAEQAGQQAEQQRIARQQAQQQAEQARQQQARELATTLAAADGDFRAGRLELAQQGYRQVLAADPQHQQARRGLARVVDGWLAQADAAIADGNTEHGRQLLEQARQGGASQARLAPLLERLDAMAGRLATVQARSELDAGQQQRLAALMDRAREAERAGRLVEPAGDSAYDLYRQALAIDPMDEAARSGVSALPRRAQTLAGHHMELGQLEQAGTALDALQAMAPLNPSLPELKRQLASAWLASGERALAAGNMDLARQAVARARELAPAHPGLAALSARIPGQ